MKQIILVVITVYSIVITGLIAVGWIYPLAEPEAPQRFIDPDGDVWVCSGETCEFTGLECVEGAYNDWRDCTPVPINEPQRPPLIPACSPDERLWVKNIYEVPIEYECRRGS